MFKRFSVFFINIFFIMNAYSASKSDCSGSNHPAYQDEYRACLRLELAERASDSGVDCVECLFQQEERQPAAWVQALSTLAGPLAYLGGAYVTAKYQYKSQEAWADAYAQGHQQCTSRFNSYLDYNTQMGANPITAPEASSLMNCNGNSYGSYSGMNGMSGNSFGGFANPWGSAGYSQGFMGGMIGPNYGGMNSGMNGFGGSNFYGGMNNNMYGGGGFGIYGNIGVGSNQNMMNYSGNNNGMFGAGMNSGAMGISSMYSNGIVDYNASTASAASNLSTSVGVSATASGGYTF